MRFFENCGQNLGNFDKNAIFMRNAIYSKLHFAL